MARRTPPRKVTYFEPVPPRLARNTIIESTFDVGRRSLGGSVARRICLAAPKGTARHVRRSCDLSSLTSSAAHSRASGIFPASLKARAFAKAWLSADRSAADSFPGCALRGLRAAV
jgi:hypothetical protein